MKHVCILNGVHRGAVIGIGEDPVLIGDGDDCDALISDASAQGSAIRISSKAGGGLFATPVRGEASRNGRPLAISRQATFAGGAVISIGDVDLAAGDDISVAEQAVSQRDKQRMMLNWGGIAVVCIAFFGVIGVIGGPADAYNAPQGVQSASLSDDIRRMQRDPIVELQDAIATSGLSDAIVLTHDESSKIVATGSVTEQERQRWQDLTRWFDGRFGDIAVLESRMSGRSDDIVLPFQIITVRAAPNPQVVTQNGRAFPVGSILPGGWEIRGIESLSVVLFRNGKELVISF